MSLPISFLKYNFFLFLIGCSAMGSSQVASVFDINRLDAVKDVFFIDHKFEHSAVSNKYGQVDLSVFSSGDTLVIQHSSYVQRIISYDEILATNKTIYLTESAVYLGEFIVMANKRVQAKNEVPNTLISIKPSEIQFNNSQTSADLLGASGEVFIQKSQLGGGSPMIRGFSANRVLIVVDGVRMNNAIFRSGNLQNVISIDPNMIELTEVIMGPGSVMYGSDALGGVMNFYTFQPKLSFNKDSIVSNSSAMVRFAMPNYENTIHANTNLGGEKLAVVFGITASRFGDLHSGDLRKNGYEDFGERKWHQTKLNNQDTFLKNSDKNIQRQSSYNQLNLTGKLRYQPSQNINLTYTVQYANTSNVPRYDRLTEEIASEPRYAEWYYGPQLWFNTNLSANFEIKNDAWDRVRTVIGYQKFRESRNDRKYKSNSLRSRSEEVDAFSLNFDFDKKINKKHSLFYGLEGVYNDISSTGKITDISNNTETPTSTRYPDGGSYWLNAAAYLTWDWILSKKVKLSSGIRYTYIEMESKFEDTTFYKFPFDNIRLSTSALNGSFIGLTYNPNKIWQGKVNTSSGFRAPNIDDLAKVFDSEPGSVVVPNKDLKPEFTYDIDLSIARKIKDQGKIEVVGFYTYLVNAMVRRDATFNGKDSIIYDGILSKVQSITNAGSAHIYGVTVNLAANISKRLGITQTFTIMDGEEIETKNPLRHVPPAFGKTGLRYRYKKVNAELFSLYNTWRHKDDLAPEELAKSNIYTSNGTPAWATLNLRTSYKFNQYISANFSVENILDKHYRPYSSGISAPGRNFIFSLRAMI